MWREPTCFCSRPRRSGVAAVGDVETALRPAGREHGRRWRRLQQCQAGAPRLASATHRPKELSAPVCYSIPSVTAPDRYRLTLTLSTASTVSRDEGVLVAPTVAAPRGTSCFLPSAQRVGRDAPLGTDVGFGIVCQRVPADRADFPARSCWCGEGLGTPAALSPRLADQMGRATPTSRLPRQQHQRGQDDSGRKAGHADDADHRNADRRNGVGVKASSRLGYPP